MAGNEFDIKSISTTSTALNGQKGLGAPKPKMSGGSDNPRDTKPPMPSPGPTPMPK